MARTEAVKEWIDARLSAQMSDGHRRIVVDVGDELSGDDEDSYEYRVTLTSDAARTLAYRLLDLANEAEE